MLPSKDPLASRPPSRTAKEGTSFSWTSSVATHAPVASSQRSFVDLGRVSYSTRPGPHPQRLRYGLPLRVVRAGGGDCLLEEGGVLAFGGPRFVRRDDLKAVDAAARALPTVARVVDGEAVAVGVVSIPLFNFFGGLVGPVVDGFAGFRTKQRFLAWVLGDVNGGPTLFA